MGFDGSDGKLMIFFSRENLCDFFVKKSWIFNLGKKNLIAFFLSISPVDTFYIDIFFRFHLSSRTTFSWHLLAAEPLEGSRVVRANFLVNCCSMQPAKRLMNHKSVSFAHLECHDDLAFHHLTSDLQNAILLNKELCFSE